LVATVKERWEKSENRNIIKIKTGLARIDLRRRGDTM